MCQNISGGCGGWVKGRALLPLLKLVKNVAVTLHIDGDHQGPMIEFAKKV